MHEKALTGRPAHWLGRSGFATVHDLFRARVAATPDQLAYRFYAPREHVWKDMTWREVAQRVRLWRRVLQANGIKRGDRVAIMLRNSPEWVCLEQAIFSLGAISVGLFCNETPTVNTHWLNDSGARLLVAVKAHWVRDLLANDACEALERTFVFTGQIQESRVYCAFAALAHAERAPECRIQPPAPSELASLVYTSGSQGRSRAAMLTHANLVFNAQEVADALPAIEAEYCLSYLPITHSYERVVNIYRSFVTGARIAFCRYPRFLGPTMAREPVTTLIGVPRLYERFYTELKRWLARQPAIVRHLVHMTINIGESVFERQQGREGFRLVHGLWPLLRYLIGRPCLRLFGGQMQLLVSGAAALPYPVARTLTGLGLPILQGYGLAEAGPVVSLNRAHDNELESVGTSLPGVDTRLSAGNELLVRSPGVMRGYWNRPEETAQAILPGGWLRTGDKISRLDQQRLYLTGRMKAVIVLSSGDKVSPEPIEAEMRLDPLVRHVLIIGEARPVLAAIISCPSHQLVPVMRRLGLDPEQPQSLQSPRLENFFLTRLQHLTQHQPRHARIRRIAITNEAWSQDNGFITASDKMRRRHIARHYARQIQRLYGQRAASDKTDVSRNSNQG